MGFAAAPFGGAPVREISRFGARLAFAFALLCAASGAAAQERLGARELPGARLEQVLVAFGREPASERETWDRSVCVGLSGVRGRREAVALSDRIALRVLEQGLEAGRPNCVPNVLVFVTPDSALLAQQLANEYRSMANEGVYGDAWIEEASLAAFVSSEAAVRWWHAPPPSPARADAAPARTEPMMVGDVFVPSRVAPGSDRPPPPAPREAFPRVLVVIDATRAEGTSLDTLGDLAAMAALGQIRQDRLPGSVDSILNRFAPMPVEGPRTLAESLTGWDQARLQGLYAAPAAAPPG